MTPWLPDYIARLYDEFFADYKSAPFAQWHDESLNVIKTHLGGLTREPHAAVAKLERYVATSSDDLQKRRFHVLLAISTAFGDVGGIRNQDGSCSDGWKEIRRQWVAEGNLLREETGHLLPRDRRGQAWAWKRPERGSVADYLQNFVRCPLAATPNLSIRVKVLPDSGLRSEILRVGIVPLVASADDLEMVPDRSRSATLRFSVRPKSPDAIREAALNALDEAAAAECDLVLFPELCLTAEIQAALSERRKKLGARARPWLVVAGSAYVPVGGGSSAGHYNQSIVLDRDGKTILTHHKLHPYTMSMPELDRYEIGEALEWLACTEALETDPYQIEVLDTSAGRIAVLICEDLSTEDFVRPLVEKLGLDWLLVPVLDGCQMERRWTAHCGTKYAEKGAAVIVATSLSLASAQWRKLDDPKSSQPGVGTIVIPPNQHDPKPRVRTHIVYGDAHDRPWICDLPLR
ncbi:MAG TPA: carbon-nitrogen hydrolase family protein [Chthoniobacteraceae bacterium]|jgi:predicted amidohydrolase|nr:carbon-nitrogen hydrolase family protein [Chthoniobacteraceae bacterium]